MAITIINEPSPQFKSAGATGAFTCGATGISPHYQWYEASATGAGLTGITGYEAMSGETGPSLYLVGVTGLQNSARYVCAVDESAIPV